ncbi:MAG: hypothetical protein QOG52_292 [Frankiaceae bacterium]|nr:hypothetical protein [Frankiaceae bacterium]MDQ1723264.1 hypothetical protein [Frankiaceae bacterium]
MSTPVDDNPQYEVHAQSRHAAGVYEQIEDSDEFRELRHRFRSFVFPMTAAFLIWYLLYVILSAWARGFMAHKLAGNINVGFVFGLLQFVSTFLIAWLYSRYANSRLDPLSAEIRHRVEGSL